MSEMATYDQVDGFRPTGGWQMGVCSKHSGPPGDPTSEMNASEKELRWPITWFYRPSRIHEGHRQCLARRAHDTNLRRSAPGCAIPE
jgi:hypothetical protein